MHFVNPSINLGFLFLELLKRYINTLPTLKQQLPMGEDDDEQERILDEEKVKDFVGDFNKFFEDLARSYKKDVKKIKKRRECFWEKYPEIFNDSSENEVEMDIDEGKTRPKKPNLAEIRKRLLCNRMTEVLTDYCGVESDLSLTLVEKMIKLQKVIGDATRRKIHFASLLGELQQSCFNESKKAYKKALEQAKIKKMVDTLLT